MNRSIKILLILFIATVAIYFLFVRKPWTTIKGELKDFAIKDTSNVTQIFIADLNHQSVTLIKQQNNTWKLNKNYIADNSKIKLLLQTIHDVNVLRPVFPKEHNTAIADLTTRGLKVIFYKGENVLKTIYVGSATPEQTGTYMLIDGSASPYVTHIPGFVGFLTPRFFAEELKWRNKLIFDYKPEEIRSIKVSFGNSEGSFSIDNSENEFPILKDGNGNIKQILDLKYLKYYVASFNQLYCEGFDVEHNMEFKDSVFKTPVFCTLIVTDKNGKSNKLQLHLKASDIKTKEQFDENGSPISNDPEKYFGFINDDKNVVYIQKYNFGKIVLKSTDFK